MVEILGNMCQCEIGNEIWFINVEYGGIYKFNKNNPFNVECVVDEDLFYNYGSDDFQAIKYMDSSVYVFHFDIDEPVLKYNTVTGECNYIYINKSVRIKNIADVAVYNGLFWLISPWWGEPLVSLDSKLDIIDTIWLSDSPRTEYEGPLDVWEICQENDNIYFVIRESSKLCHISLETGKVDVIECNIGNHLFDSITYEEHGFLATFIDTADFAEINGEGLQTNLVPVNFDYHSQQPYSRIVAVCDYIVLLPFSDKKIIIYNKLTGEKNEFSDFPEDYRVRKDNMSPFWYYSIIGGQLMICPYEANMLLVFDIEKGSVDIGLWGISRTEEEFYNRSRKRLDVLNHSMEKENFTLQEYLNNIVLLNK